MARRVKSKKYTGVYKEALEDGDISYSVLYKVNGKTIRKTIGRKSMGITEVYAYNKRSEYINLARHGEDPQAAKKKQEALQFQEVWDYYLANKGMSEYTRYDYDKRWNKHMRDPFGSKVTLDGLKAFRAKLEKGDRPLSARSIEMMISAIGSAIRFWNRRHDIKVHDAVYDLREDDKDGRTKAQKKAAKVKRERYLSLEEIKTLKDNIDGEVRLFTLVALSTGARLGTIMSIRKKDIKGNRVKLINHKTGGDTYNGYLDDETVEALKPRLKEIGENDTIFTLSQEAIQKRLQRKLNKLFNQGLETTDRANRAVVHTLRHTFASHLVMKGIPLATVQKLMGHADITMTMRYSHLAEDHGADAVLDLW